MSQCPVCSRKLKTNNPQKGDISWETTYCSHYCRLYDEQKLEKVPFAGGNKHHNNKLTWPKIKVKCEMCDNDVILKQNLECGNRKYCSRKCWNKLKGCQRRRIHQTLNLLHYLEHAYKYEGHEWLSSTIISEKCSKQGTSFTRNAVGLMMKRWREAGIVEAKFRNSSTNSYDYRLKPEGLKGLSISQFVYKWNTMSYAERMAFMSK